MMSRYDLLVGSKGEGVASSDSTIFSNSSATHFCGEVLEMASKAAHKKI